MTESSASTSDNLTNCIRCRNPARTGIKCTRCGTVSHKSCLKMLKNVKFLDDDTVICCSDSGVELPPVQNAREASKCDARNFENNVATAENVFEMKISYLEEIIRQKDLIISNQTIAIKSLTDQVALLKEIKPINNCSSECSNKELQNTGNRKKNLTYNTTSASSSASPIVSKQALSNALHSAHAHNVCDTLINLESDKVSYAKDKPRTKSRGILVGNCKSSSHCPLKAAAVSTSIRKYQYHVTNFDIDTDRDHLCNYLKTFAPNIEVEKLNSKNPSKYSSFKLSLPVEESSAIIDSNIWPNGVILNRFFPSKFLRSNGRNQSSTSENI